MTDDPRPRCARCGGPVDLFAAQDQGAAGCGACGVIVYEDGDVQPMH